MYVPGGAVMDQQLTSWKVHLALASVDYIRLVIGLRNIPTQIQGVGETLHDGASCRTANSIKLTSKGFNCSAALHWVRQIQHFSHKDSMKARSFY